MPSRKSGAKKTAKKVRNTRGNKRESPKKVSRTPPTIPQEDAVTSSEPPAQAQQ